MAAVGAPPPRGGLLLCSLAPKHFLGRRMSESARPAQTCSRSTCMHAKSAQRAPGTQQSCKTKQDTMEPITCGVPVCVASNVVCCAACCSLASRQHSALNVWGPPPPC
eukprot:14005632-Alexandrium_andersonii.AAC.1